MNRFTRNTLSLFSALITIAFLLVLASVPQDARGEVQRTPPTLEQALLGHWRTVDGYTDYFFGPGSLIMVDKGKRQDQRWAEIKQDANARTIEIQVTVVSTGMGHVKRITFDKNYLGVDQTVLIAGYSIPGRWLYIDGEQSPPVVIRGSEGAQ